MIKRRRKGNKCMREKECDQCEKNISNNHDGYKKQIDDPRYHSLKPTLELEHSIVDSSFFNQFYMSSSFCYLSSIQNNDLICFAYGLETMRDDDDRSSLKKFIKGYGDCLF